MSTPTPTPHAAARRFSPAIARTLERELTALTAERDQLRAEVKRLRECVSTPAGLRLQCGRLFPDYEWNDSEFIARLRALAERAEKSERLWREFITLMEITEESDSGNEFNPNKISSCRAMDGHRLNEILNEARQIVFDTPKE